MVISLIGGKSVASTSEDTFEVFSPSTGKWLYSMPVGAEADVNRAVTSARKAFDEQRWSDAPPSFKKTTLHRFADFIEQSAVELDALDAEEMGKPLSTGFANAQSAASLVRFYAEAVDKLTGDVFTSGSTSFVTQRRVPRGVVAAIAPWNFPTMNALLKVAPALAAGNCVVLKPSELSSRSAIRLAQLSLEAGIPHGVFNVVPGIGKTVGRALGLHPDVDMLTFTGSTEIGKRMLQYAGQSNMKKVIAECGGKSPQIVFADGVDLDAAADAIAGSILTNQGQVCVAGSRLLVEKKIETILTKKVVDRFKDIVMGDPLDPNTTYGPIVTEQQCNKVMAFISRGCEAGAELVCGGKRALQETGGFYIEPTILKNVSPTADIAQQEIFGPVLSVMTFENEDEAIQLANNTIYGLAAYIWTTKLTTGMKLANSIRSSVLVNAVAPTGEGAGHALSAEPFGQSGIGVEGGLAGLETYQRRQAVWFNHG